MRLACYGTLKLIYGLVSAVKVGLLLSYHLVFVPVEVLQAQYALLHVGRCIHGCLHHTQVTVKRILEEDVGNV